MDCTKSVEKEARIQARVKVFPETEAGKVEFECIGEPRREPCKGTQCPECDFIISQMICLKIPIKFSVDAAVVETGIVCDKKSHKCEPHPCDGMWERRGFVYRKDDRDVEQSRTFARNILLTYKNNPERK